MKKKRSELPKISIKKRDKSKLKPLRFSLKNKIKDSKHFLKPLLSLLSVSIVVIAVASYFIFNSKWIGPAFLAMGVLNVLFMKSFGIKLKFIYPDLAFGFVDNGVMV